jgi:hypothetical protein
MSTTIAERGIFITAREAAYLAAGIKLDAIARRRDRVTLPADITDTFDRIVVEGAGYSNRQRSPLSSAKSICDSNAVAASQLTWTTVQAASLSLSKSAQTVRTLLRGEHLHGERAPDGRHWRVCADDVTARMKGMRCQHV